MNLNPGDQAPMTPRPEGRSRRSRPGRRSRPAILYYGFVSYFFGFATVVAFATGAPVMAFMWGFLGVSLLLLSVLVHVHWRRHENDPLTRTPHYDTTQQPPGRPVWSPGMRFEPSLHGYQPGLRAGDTSLPTAAQNEARNMYGNNAS
jgi:hypothetical protein